MLRLIVGLCLTVDALCQYTHPKYCACEEDAGVSYEGTVSRTTDGISCMYWKDASNQSYRDLPENYCRNADGNSAGVWCYTEGKNWGYCDVPKCECEDYDPSECGCSSVNQADYRGDLNVTRLGKTCQEWGSQYPNIHPYDPSKAKYKDDGLDSNYCRNPGMESESTWCYIEDGSNRWDYCNVQTCGVTSSTTTTVAACDNFDSSKCGCRDNHQSDYRGNIRETVEGKECQRWDSQYPNQHPYRPSQYIGQGLDENYCRNPDASGYRAWCYLADGNSTDRWQYCDIPMCGESTTSTTTTTRYNKIIVKSKFEGVKINNSMYYNISAVGTTSVGLQEGDLMQVKLDNEWRNVSYTSDGKWSFDSDDARTIGTGVVAQVAIFDLNDNKVAQSIINFSGEPDKTGQSSRQRIIVDYQSDGQYVNETTYKGISAVGRSERSLESGQYMAYELLETWHDISYNDITNVWHFQDKRGLKMGKLTEVKIGIFDKAGNLSIAEVLYFDGKDSNDITVLYKSEGFQVSSTEYKRIELKGTLKRPLNVNERLRARATPQKFFPDEDNYWSVNTGNDVFTIGGYINCSMYIENSLGMVIVEVPGTCTGNLSSNPVILHGKQEQYLSDYKYSHITAYGRTKLPRSNGEYMAVKIDGKWKKIPEEDAIEGDWAFTDSEVRTTGEITEVIVGLFTKDGVLRSSLPIQFDGSEANAIVILEQNDGYRIDGSTFMNGSVKFSTVKPLKMFETMSVRLGKARYIRMVAPTQFKFEEISPYKGDKVDNTLFVLTPWNETTKGYRYGVPSKSISFEYRNAKSLGFD